MVRCFTITVKDDVIKVKSHDSQAEVSALGDSSSKGGKYKQHNASHLCSDHFSADHVTYS